jgi:Helix-turn-helix of DDE superfamily endonuclease
MPKFDSILQHERRLRAMSGLDTATFTAFLPHFTLAMERYLQHTTLDGYVREGDRAITYANSPLPTPQDRLLFILTYLKQNPIQELHGQLFSMSQSNVSKWVRLLLDILDTALANQGLLPARTAAELAAQLQAEATPLDSEAPPFFATMAPNDRSHDRKMRMNRKSTTVASRKTIPSKM